MMQAYRTEGNYRSAARLSPAELRAAMANREILQATALAFDTQRQLRFEIGGVRAVMPFAQCADGAETGTVRDIAVLTRVGRPTCFVIEGLDMDEDGAPCYRLSRAEAQRLCKAEYLDTLSPGDILPCTVTHIEPFGAYSRRVKSLAELPAGADVVIPNDPSNNSRALILLDKAGVIKLKDPSNALSTQRDIIDNPKQLRFRELDSAMLPRVLDQVDLALINTNYALDAGLNPTQDALAIESKDSPYVNFLVARPDSRDDPRVQKLAKALTGPEVKAFIEHKDDLVFLDIRTERETNVYPMVAAGKGLSEIIMAEPL